MIDFSRQDKTPELCQEARVAVAASKIAIVGVGALGTVAAELLVRAGAQRLVLIDDDVVEASNLPRQTLYGEKNIGEKKVVVAERALKAIRSDLSLDIHDTRLVEKNADIVEADVVLDCTDSLASRKVIADWCKKNNQVWVHAAAIGTVGQVMIVEDEYILEGKDVEENCEGIMGVTTSMTASLQVAFALRLLVGKTDDVKGHLFRIYAWEGRIEKFLS